MRPTLLTTALVAVVAASLTLAAPTPAPAPAPALLSGLGNGLTSTVNSIVPASLGKDLSALAAQLGITVDELLGRITTPLGVQVTGAQQRKRDLASSLEQLAESLGTTVEDLIEQLTGGLDLGKRAGLLSTSPLTGLLGGLPILSQIETPLFALIASLGTNVNALVAKLGLGNVLMLSSVAGGNNLGMSPVQLSTFLNTIATKLGLTLEQLLASLNLTNLNLPSVSKRGLFDLIPLKNLPLVGALVNSLTAPLTFIASGLSTSLSSVTSKLGLDGLLSLAAIQQGGLDATSLQTALSQLAAKLGTTVQALVSQLTAAGLDLSKLPVSTSSVSKRDLLSTLQSLPLVGSIVKGLTTELTGIAIVAGITVNDLVTKLGLAGILQVASISSGNLSPLKVQTLLGTIAEKLGVTVAQLVAALNLPATSLPSV